MTVEIPLRLKYRIGGKAKRGKSNYAGRSGKKRFKGVLFPVGIRKSQKVRRK